MTSKRFILCNKLFIPKQFYLLASGSMVTVMPIVRFVGFTLNLTIWDDKQQKYFNEQTHFSPMRMSVQECPLSVSDPRTQEISDDPFSCQMKASPLPSCSISPPHTITCTLGTHYLIRWLGVGSHLEFSLWKQSFAAFLQDLWLVVYYPLGQVEWCHCSCFLINNYWSWLKHFACDIIDLVQREVESVVANLLEAFLFYARQMQNT